MNTCPNCKKVAGLHSSILQGCVCQYSMQAPPQRTWQGLTDEEKHKTWYEMQNIMGWYSFQEIANAIEAKLKEKNF